MVLGTTIMWGVVLVTMFAGDAVEKKPTVEYLSDLQARFALLKQGWGELGIDVSADKFIDAVQREKPDILALSCLFTPTRLAMKDVVQGLHGANLRDKVKVLIGGAPIDQKFADLIGADGYAPDAPSGVQKARTWMGN